MPRRRALVLAVCCAAQFMVILDLSIVNVALPSIQVSLKFSSNDLQWVVDAYAIIFAGFLMLAGRAVDTFEQRRVFSAGLTLFSLASLTGGLAQSPLMLIIARGVQGLGGAMMAASSLAIITSTFPAGPERHRAIGLWGAMNGAGGAAGVLFGGIITDAISWRWVLLINVPIGIAAAVMAFRVVARKVAEENKGFDLLGALVLSSSLLILAYGGVKAGSDGFGSPQFIVSFIVGNVIFGFFPVVEKHAKAPLVPPGSFSGALRMTNIIVLLFSSALFPMWYLGSLYLQQVISLSPLQTGLTFLPITALIFICASQAGKLVSRAGPKPVLSAGLLMLGAGIALMARIQPSGSSIQYIMLPGFLVGAGIGLSIVPSTIAATMTAGAARTGLASGLVNTSRQVGGGLGLAVLISIANRHTSVLIGQNHPVNNALTDGFKLSYEISAGLVFLAALLTLFVLRLPSPAAAPAPAPAAVEPEDDAGTSLAVAAPDALPLAAAELTAAAEHAGAAPAASAAAPAPAAPAAAARSRRMPLARAVPATAIVFIALFVGVDFAIPRSVGAPIGAYSLEHTMHFVTEPGLHPPVIRVETPIKASKFPGFVMYANFLDVTKAPIKGQSGPEILDSNMQPVWLHPVPIQDAASNFEKQTYEGKPVLTWWQGVTTPTGLINSGEDVVVNQHYQTVATLHAQGPGWIITLHGFEIRGHDAWVTVNRNIQKNLSSFGGTNDGVLVESGIQEYDLRTGKLLYTWSADGNVPLSDSHTVPPPNGFPWDALHVNSVWPVGNGLVLVSFRNTWSAVLLDTKTNKIVWTLGGRHNQFKIPSQAVFQWQHDVELHGDTLTLFDDACCEITGAGQYLDPTGPSRGLVFHIDQATKTLTLQKEFDNNQGFDAEYMGNTQLLPNGGAWIGWGDAPFMSLYSPAGKVIFQAELPSPDIGYRAYLQSWVGTPLTKPIGAARTVGGHTVVYASWNGATQLAGWKVLSLSGSGTAQTVAQGKKTGFETQITVPGGAQSYELQALDAGGNVLSTSAPFSLKS